MRVKPRLSISSSDISRLKIEFLQRSHRPSACTLFLRLGGVATTMPGTFETKFAPGSCGNPLDCVSSMTRAKRELAYGVGGTKGWLNSD